jgi:hypothetical protein
VVINAQVNMKKKGKGHQKARAYLFFLFKTVNTLAIKNVQAKWLQDAFQTQKKVIQTKPSSTTTSPIVSSLSPTLAPIGAVTAVMYSLLAPAVLKNATSVVSPHTHAVSGLCLIFVD